MGIGVILKIFTFLRSNGKLTSYVVIGIVFVVLLGYIYYLSSSLDIERANHKITTQNLAIEKTNTETLQTKLDLQTRLHTSVNDLLQACYANRQLEADLNSQREEIIANDVPIAVEQDEPKTGVKVVNRETRKRGIALVNSLMQ